MKELFPLIMFANCPESMELTERKGYTKQKQLIFRMHIYVINSNLSTKIDAFDFISIVLYFEPEKQKLCTQAWPARKQGTGQPYMIIK